MLARRDLPTLRQAAPRGNLPLGQCVVQTHSTRNLSALPRCVDEFSQSSAVIPCLYSRQPCQGSLVVNVMNGAPS